MNTLYRIGHWLVIAGAVAALALLAAPILALVWRALQENALTRIPNEAVQTALQLSLTTTFISLLVIFVIGTPLAYILARRRFYGRRWFNILVELPIVLPPSVAGLALLFTFGNEGLLRDFSGQVVFTSAAVVITQVFVALPFYVRAVQTGFSNIHPEIEQAAMVDGASQWGTFLYVTLPLSSRSIVTGGLLSWARALGEFGATILFAGNLEGETRTMPLLIFIIRERDINAAIWTSLILIALAILAVGLTRFLADDRAAQS